MKLPVLLIKTISQFKGIGMSQLFSFLPDTLTTPEGTALRSLLTALDEQDTSNLVLAEDARKELFITTATGRYLILLASQYGFVVPRWAGLDTKGIRTLAVPAIFLPKQSKDTFKNILEAFYAKEILHPSISSTSYEPYSLSSGDTLILTTDSGEVIVSFSDNQFADISSVTAGELAGIINSQQRLVYADSVYDRTVNASQLRITSNTYGVEARLRVSGGSAQNILRFPQIKPVFSDSTTVWEITKEYGKNYADLVTFTYSAGSRPELNLLDMGDLVSIRDQVDTVDANYSALNGTYEVLNAGMIDQFVGYFTIRNLQFQSTGEVFPRYLSPTGTTDFCFTSSRMSLVYDNREYALIAEPRIGEVLISVPPIPPITRRFLEGSAHLHGTKAAVVDFTRNTIVLNGELDLPSTGTFGYESAQTTERQHKEYLFRYTAYGYSGGNTVVFLPNNPRATNYMPFIDYSEANSEFAASGIDNPVYLEIESNDVVVSTPGVPHGFEVGQQIEIDYVDLFPAPTATVLSIDGGFLNSDINTSHIVKDVIDRYNFSIEILINGDRKRYLGAEVTGFDIESLGLPVNGADIVFTFASESDRSSAGFVNGMKVRYFKSGTILNTVMANYLRDTPLVVIFQSGDSVYLSSGRGVIFSGAVVTGASCYRSAYVGGTVARYKISDPYTGLLNNWNYDGWFKNAKVVLLDGKIEDNPDFVSSYLYDLLGEKSSYVVSSVSTKLWYEDPGTFARPFIITRKQAPGELLVESVEGFPDSGYLVISYGTDGAEGPISYSSFSGTGPYKIFIDRSYVFRETHGVEAEVRYLRSTSPIVLTDDARDYPVYITDAMTARELIGDVLKSVSASGIKITVESQHPDLRFYEAEIDPFESRVDRGI